MIERHFAAMLGLFVMIMGRRSTERRRMAGEPVTLRHLLWSGSVVWAVSLPAMILPKVLQTGRLLPALVVLAVAVALL
jgi:hypothetical protein